MAAILSSAGKGNVSEPDFAYPQKVLTDARAMLAKYDDSTSDDAAPIRIRALLEIVKAATMIDPDSAFAMPALIEEQLGKKGLSDTDKAMLKALEAEVFKKIYERQSYKYDEVTAPLEPFPADISLWSGEQFKHRINALFAEAHALAAKESVPLSRYGICLEYNEYGLLYIPDVAAFANYKNLQWLNHDEQVAFAAKVAGTLEPGSAQWCYWSVIAANYNTKKLNELYSQYASSPEARYILGKIHSGGNFCDYDEAPVDIFGEEEVTDPNDIKNRDKLITILEESLKAFPDWYDNNQLRNTLSSLKQPRLKATYNRLLGPGSNLVINVSTTFCKSATFKLYKLPARKNYSLRTVKASKNIVERKVTSLPNDTAFTVEIPIEKAGYYAWTVAINDREAQEIRFFDVAPIYPVALNGLENQYVAVADMTTGAPVPDVEVTLKGIQWRKDTNGSHKLGKTDRNGVLGFNAYPDSVYNSQTLSFTYRGNTYSFNDNIRTYLPTAPKPSTNSIVVLTDRKLYHQGDTVRWAVVASDKDKVAAGETVKVEFYDANYQKVEDTNCVLDAYGRGEGSFVTKQDVLTGSWRINASIGDTRTTCYVEVSDFSLPTFHADVTSVERDAPSAGCVRLSGTATTYSGMPVAGAKVVLALNTASRQRWFFTQEFIGNLETVTDLNGGFTFDIPADMLGDNKDFFAEITVTSADASTAMTSRGFTTGKPYVLGAECAKFADTSAPVAVKFTAYDANGKDVAIPVKWEVGKLNNAGKMTEVFARGDATTGESAMLALCKVAAGEYTLRAMPADEALAEAVNANNIVLYNEKKNEVPSCCGHVFVPSRNVKTTGNTANILVGISGKAAYVYVAVTSGGKLVSIKPEKLAPGFHRLKVKVESPDSRVRLFSVFEAELSDFDIGIERSASAKTQIVAESFRDKLVPGATETWRFRLLGADGNAIDAAMIATLYNRALDALSEGSWPSQLRGYATTPVYYLGLSSLNSKIAYASTNVPFKYLSTATIEYPQYAFINYYGGYKIRGMNAMKLESAVPCADAADSEEAFARKMFTVGAQYNEAEAEEITVQTDEEESAGQTKADNFEYRVAEVLQAFWRPSLTADKDGNIDITFTVPNANGAWRFKALAWGTKLESASYIAECVSSKPVMVQPNLPRYLRQGDNARVLATVFNNTDETAVVTTTVEIFDIASGATLTSAVSTNTIAAKGSAIAAINVKAPVDAASVGYRVRSQSGNFADGEQSLIPILASSATVVESTEFYLNPGDSKPFELSLKTPADASVTLQYCQNPVWTAVKAMRGLTGSSFNTATGYAAKLFSALAADKIIADNPAIASVIRHWQENPSEGVLKSMLEKNEDLKLLLLDQTPWVQTAADETSRMAMLTQVLDKDKTQKAIAACVAELRKLQNSDGGFAWTSWSQASSEWSTRNVLITLGIANSLGMLDAAGVDKMVKDAYSYLVTQALKPKRPKTDTELAYIASAFPQLNDKRATTLIANTEAFIIKNWKNGNVLDKAVDILIIKKKYPRTATQMLQSIRQFCVEKPGMGVTFPSIADIRSYASIIRAYAAMDAPKKEIDALRQWVLVQGQASDDFGAYNPDYVIAALMLTGSVWTDVPVSNSVRVNGKAVDISGSESASGYFSRKLDVSGKFTVSVAPNGVTPSYGSVITVDRRPMTEIKARPGRDISIEKRVLVQRDGKWVETGSFALGERVRVQLVIKTTRNLEYVSITDERPAAFEPVEQLPGFVWDGGVAFYRENLDASTRLAIGYLAKGSYYITYDMTANVAGSFISGIATLQSQYAPELTAHSGGNVIEVK